MKKKLTIRALKIEANLFIKKQDVMNSKKIYGVTDGKAVGTYIEKNFKDFLNSKYDFDEGSAAHGIDFPSINLDIKTTSIKQPQSSCPFKSASQKIFGLGYNLLIFVYQKIDDQISKKGKLNILNIIFVDEKNTGDYQLTYAIRQAVKNKGNLDDIISIFQNANLPIDEITANQLAKKILSNKPNQGYLTISNALQWRLQYSRVIELANKVEGVLNLK